MKNFSVMELFYKKILPSAWKIVQKFDKFDHEKETWCTFTRHTALINAWKRNTGAFNSLAKMPLKL